MELDRDHPLDRNWVALERLTGWIGALAIGGGAVLVTLVVILLTRPPLAIGSLLFGAALTLFLLLACAATFWPEAAWRRASWRLTDRSLEIRRGVFFRSIVNLPRSRVQHTDVSQGPLERRFGLATLVVHTAGTAHASVELPGLPHATAIEVRDFLVTAGRGDAV
jgi:membrane protein YdbS with pleckstrin-like domain